MKPPIALVGIPFDANSSFMKGPALAPPIIRKMATGGSANDYAESGLEIREGIIFDDAGDLVFEDNDPRRAFEKIHSSISGLLGDYSNLLCLGGDHSTSWPIIRAYAAKYPTLNVLHIDAHADLYANFDDNAYSHASPFARIMEEGLVNKLWQIGIRTLNAHQREQAKKFGVEQVEMKDWPKKIDLHSPLYISLDLDALDPGFAPGVSHHEPGGFSVRELLTIIQQLPVQVVGADIVEYNPTRDHHDMTAMVAFKFMKELMAKMIIH